MMQRQTKCAWLVVLVLAILAWPPSRAHADEAADAEAALAKPRDPQALKHL